MSKLPLSSLMILTPGAETWTLETRACFRDAEKAGAFIWARSPGRDPARQRCELAGDAFRILTGAHERGPEIETVAWVDPDMVFDVGMLMATLRMLRDIRHELDGEVMGCTVTGLYFEGNQPGVLAVREHLEAVNLVVPSCLAIPVDDCGFGCLFQSREGFLAHCSEVPWIEDDNGRGGLERFPAFCRSGPFQEDDGKWIWESEGLNFLAHEWKRDRPVFAIPVSWGRQFVRGVFPEVSPEPKAWSIRAPSGRPVAELEATPVVLSEARPIA